MPHLAEDGYLRKESSKRSFQYVDEFRVSADAIIQVGYVRVPDALAGRHVRIKITPEIINNSTEDIPAEHITREDTLRNPALKEKREKWLNEQRIREKVSIHKEANAVRAKINRELILKQKKASQQKTYEDGRCIQCGQPRETKHRRCNACRALAREYTQQVHDWRIKVGLCTTCGGYKPKDKHLTCPDCREKTKKKVTQCPSTKPTSTG